jgi:two-component sensor histidine kinase
MRQRETHTSQAPGDAGELSRAHEHLSLVLSATGVGVWERDIAADKVTWSAAFRAGYEAAVRGDGDCFAQEFRVVRGDGEVRWVYRRGQVHRGSDGRALSVLGVALDVTDRKEREARIRLLMSEVLHRSKNLLAVVQAIASQTARSTSSPTAFAEDFGARLKSLASSLDLLVRRDWRGVSVRDLVQSQLSHCCDPDGARVRLEGPDLLLSPPAAQYLGMALHELATNAEKHGAFAVPTGSVPIEWGLAGPSRERRFRMSWVESGGAPVEPPSTRGFGRLVIERMAAEALQGRATLAFAREGVRWVLDADAAAVVQGACG